MTTPKAVTVGCTPNPYIQGIVYSDGGLAPGSSCSAPILEIRNTLCEAVAVFYESGVCAGFDALANRQIVPAKGTVLLMNVRPTTGHEDLGKITIQDDCERSASFLLVHDAVHGYDVQPAHHVEGSGIYRCRSLKLNVYKDPFVLNFCGCSQPLWGDNVLVPLRIQRSRDDDADDE